MSHAGARTQLLTSRPLSYWFQPADKNASSWGWGRGAVRSASPASWINGVNNSPSRHSSLIMHKQTLPLVSARGVEGSINAKTAQSKPATCRARLRARLCKLTHTQMGVISTYVCMYIPSLMASHTRTRRQGGRDRLEM